MGTLTRDKLRVLVVCKGSGKTIAQVAREIGIEHEKASVLVRSLARLKLLDSVRDARMRTQKLGGSPMVYWTTKAGLESMGGAA